MSKQASTAPKRPTALAPHIGVNEVSAAYCAGWTGPLATCEFDAQDTAAIAQADGMKSTLLLTRKAKRAAVLAAIVKKFHPALILISGRQDNPFSMDSNHNGAFTEQLLSVWANGSFKGSYASLHARVHAGLPPTQSPNLFTLGPAAAFLKQAPFSV